MDSMEEHMTPDGSDAEEEALQGLGASGDGSGPSDAKRKILSPHKEVKSPPRKMAMRGQRRQLSFAAEGAAEELEGHAAVASDSEDDECIDDEDEEDLGIVLTAPDAADEEGPGESGARAAAAEQRILETQNAEIDDVDGTPRAQVLVNDFERALSLSPEAGRVAARGARGSATPAAGTPSAVPGGFGSVHDTWQWKLRYDQTPLEEPLEEHPQSGAYADLLRYVDDAPEEDTFWDDEDEEEHADEGVAPEREGEDPPWQQRPVQGWQHVSSDKHLRRLEKKLLKVQEDQFKLQNKQLELHRQQYNTMERHLNRTLEQVSSQMDQLQRQQLEFQQRLESQGARTTDTLKYAMHQLKEQQQQNYEQLQATVQLCASQMRTPAPFGAAMHTNLGPAMFTNIMNVSSATPVPPAAPSAPAAAQMPANWLARSSAIPVTLGSALPSNIAQNADSRAPSMASSDIKLAATNALPAPAPSVAASPLDQLSAEEVNNMYISILKALPEDVQAEFRKLLTATTAMKCSAKVNPRQAATMTQRELLPQMQHVLLYFQSLMQSGHTGGAPGSVTAVPPAPDPSAGIQQARGPLHGSAQHSEQPQNPAQPPQAVEPPPLPQQLAKPSHEPKEAPQPEVPSSLLEEQLLRREEFPQAPVPAATLAVRAEDLPAALELLKASEEQRRQAADDVNRIFSALLAQLPSEAQQHARDRLARRTAAMQRPGLPTELSTMHVQQSMIPVLQRAVKIIQNQGNGCGKA